jgi:hypothetical protein
MDQRHVFPGELPEIPSGWSGGELGLVPGEGFWARIEQIAVKGEMTRGLDTAMQGHSSPRIWLFLHEPGRGELSTAAAMSFARELAFRDQAALLLDCDDREMALTRWAGRVEAEGWIDLARYGTSVLTSGVPMPFVGRRGYMLGVGSFAPTDVTSEEIDTLLTRLRRQADDLLLVAPADSFGRLWAPAAAIRIFCWDRQTMSDEEAGAIATEFTEAGCPLTAVATFQKTGVAEEQLVDDVLAEVESAPEAPTPATPSESEVEKPPAQVGPETGPETETEPETGPGEEEPEDDSGVEVEEPDLEDEGWEEPVPEPEPIAARETSRVFWFGALVALALIAVVTVYFFKFVRVPTEGHFEQINVATETESSVSGDEVMSTGAADGDKIPALAAGADSLAVPVDDEGDTLGTVAVIEPVREAAPDSVPSPEVATDEAGQDDGERQEAPVARPVEIDMSPYSEPVGAKGWALHVYSLPDSPGTAKQVKELDRRGFRSEVKIFDLGEKGRWFRIYLGSFASRSEAKQAMPALLEKLRQDWAKPEPFTTSAPE